MIVDDDTTPISDDDTTPPSPVCGPLASPLTPWLTEGETGTVSLICDSGWPVSDFTVEVTGAPAAASFLADTWTLEVPTGWSDAGRYDIGFAIRPVADPGAEPEIASTTLWVADAWSMAENVPVDPGTYQEEWGLPVLHLFPDGEVTEEYITGSAWFQGVEYSIEVKYRGAASLGYPKKSYTIDFKDGNLHADEFDMPDQDKLILITSFDDNSYIRQKLAYDVWKDMAMSSDDGRIIVRTFFAVVYIEGAYLGLYTAADHIDDDLMERTGYSPDGNLFKSVDHNANFYRWDSGGNPKPALQAGWEKKEGLPEAGEAGAYQDIQDLTAFSADSDDETFMTEADSWIHVDEFMDWFLFVHYLSAGDSAGKNAYVYNDPENPGFRYAPWDFNQCFGQDWMTLRIPPDIYEDFQWTNGIFAHFQNHPEASEILWDRFGTWLDGGPLSLDTLLDRVDSYHQSIGPSAVRDEGKWGGQYRDFYYWADYRDWYGDWNDYVGEHEYVVDWLTQRDEWMHTYHP